MRWEPQGKGRLSHRRVWDLPGGLAEGSHHVGHTGQQVPQQLGGPLPARSSQNQELHKEMETLQGRGQKSPDLLCIWSGVSVCLSTLLLAHRLHLCLWWAPAPVCTRPYRCVRYAGRGRSQSFPSLFRFKPSQFLGGSPDPGAGKGEGNCGHFLPGGETVATMVPLQQVWLL